MEVTLVGASWDVVAGDQNGCGLHSYEALWRTELPCARGRGLVWPGRGRVGSPTASAWFPGPSGAFSGGPPVSCMQTPDGLLTRVVRKASCISTAATTWCVPVCPLASTGHSVESSTDGAHNTTHSLLQRALLELALLAARRRLARLGRLLVRLLGRLARGVGLVHLVHADLDGRLVHDDRLGVVLADDAARRLLVGNRRLPRLVDVLGGQLGELRQPVAHVVAVLVPLLGEGHGRVAAEVLVEEART
eukprot:scaffold19370_cov56-Phaeocystis_antarctica.AAC.3